MLHACFAGRGALGLPVSSSRVSARPDRSRVLQKHLQPTAEEGRAVLLAGAAAGQHPLRPNCSHALHAAKQVGLS